MSSIQIEFGEAYGVSVKGTAIPILAFDGSVRETIDNATSTTQTTIQAPGIVVGRRSTAVAMVTAVDGAHWISFGTDPVVFATGLDSFVPAGKSRAYIVRPGYKAAVLEHGETLPMPPELMEWPDGSPMEWPDGDLMEWPS